MKPRELFSPTISHGLHLSGDIHNIGESLPAPDSVSDVGTEAWIGESNTPARADHVHGAGGALYHFHEIIWSYGTVVNPSSNVTLNRYVYSHWKPFQASGAILTYVSAATSQTIEVDIYINAVLEGTLSITSGNVVAPQTFEKTITNGDIIWAVVKANAAADGEDLTIMINGYIECAGIVMPI